MRNFYVISIFTILCFQLSLAQHNYGKDWQKVENLELKGKLTSANKVVQRIYKRADKEQNTEQIIKSFIYSSKFSLLLKEDAESLIFNQLQKEIDKQSFPTNAILENIYADFLSQYLKKHQYKIRSRSYVKTAVVANDYQIWDIQTFLIEINRHFQNSIQQEKALQQLPVKDYLAFMKGKGNTLPYRSTLYDILAHNMLDFYKNNLPHHYQIRDTITYSKEYFDVNGSFLKIPFKTTTEETLSKFNTLRLFQNLEKLHQNTKDAYVDVVLQRLKFIATHSAESESRNWYAEALVNLANKCANNPNEALLNYEIATEYIYRSQTFQLHNNNATVDIFKTKAQQLATRTIAKYPNSQGSIKCKLLLKEIEKEYLKFTVEEFSVPNKPMLARVELKNIDTLKLKIYKTSKVFKRNHKLYDADSLVKIFAKTHVPFLEKEYILKIPKDYNEHTTEISIPKLPLGKYLIVATNTKNEHDENYLFKHVKTVKTNIAVMKTEYIGKQQYIVADRTSGKPIYKAKIEVWNANGTVKQKLFTNLKGEATIEKRAEEIALNEMITYEKDTLEISGHLDSKRADKNDEDDEYFEARAFILMDRSIYRPGQTIYFKGIALQYKNEITSVVPNVYFEVSIYANRDEIKTFRLKTNEFGSFNESFTLPKNAPTGEYSISIDEDYEYEKDENYNAEEDEHPFWDYVGFTDRNTYFQVEEYKRPRFEVILNPITENYRFNDYVIISGKAKALLGSVVSEANVKYTIKRKGYLKDYTNNDRENFNKTIVVATDTTKTDAKGNFKISFDAIADSNIKKEDLNYHSYTIDIEIIDLNGETQTAEKTIDIGYDDFEFHTIIPSEHSAEKPFNIDIRVLDLNGVPLKATGKLNIYKRENPKRTYVNRPWKMPETYQMQKEVFTEQFPHFTYDKNDEVLSKIEDSLLLSETFDINKNKITTYDFSTWESGTYILEAEATTEFGATREITKTFTIKNKKDTFLKDNRIFKYHILNTDFIEDGFIEIKLLSSFRDTPLQVYIHSFHKTTLEYYTITTLRDGMSIIKIPIQKNYDDQFTIHFSFVKFNTFQTDYYTYSFKSRKKYLNIETVSFRNKLLPGTPETWSFKITDFDNNVQPTELLASMYDESLDQIEKHEWDGYQYYFGENYYSIPNVDAYEGFRSVKTSSYSSFINVTKIPNFRDYIKFDWFGFNLNNTQFNNKHYLMALKYKKKNETQRFGNISGVVTDDTGLPLPGATVLIKGTETGVTTDFDGLYVIKANPEDTLTFSYVGFTTKKIVVGNYKSINAKLEPGNALEAVVIVAYGGATTYGPANNGVITVNGEVISRIPTGSLEQILSGAAAGVSVNTGSGQSGSSATIIIRGTATLQGDVEPLFVVDGVPVSRAVFRNLNQGNITSLSVLKDISATALYGGRGANGVVLITTKYGTTKEIIDGKEVVVGLSEEDIETVETRKDLKETAFFYPNLRTNSEGIVSFTFTSPEALTRWKLQLFAHQKNGAFGNTEKNAVTQKELMVVPNMPRFLREKDTIVIASKIVNIQNKTTKGIASLRLFDAQTMESIDAKVHLAAKNKAFTIDAKGNTNVSWKLYIPEGVDAIQYKVIAKAGNYSDGEESALPVLKNSILITEAKPIWVKAGEEKEVTFSKLANNTSTSLKHHKLTLEYTSNPTWSAIQSLPYLLEYPYECAEQTFARLYANMISGYILQSSPEIKEVFESWKANEQLVSDLEKNSELKTMLLSETPWVRDAASETKKKQRLTQLFDKKTMESLQLEMLLKLEDMQTASGGFPWFSGGKENLYITLHILQTYGHLVKLGAISDEESSVTEIMKDAYSFADNRFLMAYSIQKKSTNKSTFKQQLRYLYTRSMITAKMPISKEVKKVMNFYLDNLQKKWVLLSLEEKAMLALSLERMGKHREAKKIMESLEESAVKTTESGMYWKEITEARYSNSHAVEKQALLIEAFSEITKDDTIVQELQLWLLQQKQTSQWATTKATTKAIYALLLNPTAFVSIKDNTVFTIGTKKIKTKKLDETAKEAGSGYFKTSWNKDEITKDKATIKVSNNSKTVGFGGIYWQYFEELENITQNDEASLQVTKELYVKEKEMLIPLAKRSLKIGDLITVRLTIRNKKDLEFIHLKDMRAAGLEPVNVLSEYKWQDGIGYFESTRDASTNFFFDRVPKGVFILEYEVRVNNIGEFSNGITTIESMYAPEFRSHTKGIRITVAAE
ncbi:TonB-dependent receptor SusC [Kordia antarctica]|uniref:TonB-dependent receptor SusC n=1 Tax=Kordia antarctica TaxID=1218801 RepID=A0A7L4ZJG7_9FLAO|nr:alpha-2-macroglobulin family protein [Kordia antarctica]QHI36627.1 TonB-dependent receptor SusC [Kordia antarctica]